jgi:hypothetical protein
MLNLYPSFGVPHTPKYRDYKACFAAIVGFRSAFCFGRRDERHREIASRD